MKFFIEKILGFFGMDPKRSQKIPKDPKFFGVISNESQKIWDHPKKIGVILGWFGGDTRGSETVTRKQEKTFIYVTVTE